MTHTPAPWIQDETFVTVPSGDKIIAKTMISVPYDVALANARLIAAAPELLAALKEVIGGGHLAHSPHPDADLVIKLVNDAISKAEGDA